MKRWIRRLVVVGAVCLLAGIGFSIYVGRQLIAPVPRVIGKPPELLGGETVEFASGSGSKIVGWLDVSKDADASILLLHARGEEGLRRPRPYSHRASLQSYYLTHWQIRRSHRQVTLVAYR